MNKTIYAFVFFISILILGFFIYDKYSNKFEYIDFDKTVAVNDNHDHDTIAIGMISVSGGNRGFVAEKELANYIGKKLNKKVKFIQRRSYKEINTLLKNNEIDIAFLSTGAYVLYDDKESLELIAKPNRGTSFYHPVVIAKSNSAVKYISDLENNDFAFVDAYSYSGYLYLSNYFEEQNTSVDKFFNKKYYFTYSHEQSIRQVANENVKGAVVDDWALQYLEKNDPALFAEVKIIETFPAVSTGPVVTKKNYGQIEELKNILFNINKDAEIRDLLEQLQIDSYDETKKEYYPTLKGEPNVG